MYRLLRTLFRWLPIAHRHKLRLKEYVYAKHGRLFAESPGYRVWWSSRARPIELPSVKRPSAPEPDDWRAIAVRRAAGLRATQLVGDPVVLVPIFEGYDTSLACLYSVLDADPVTTVVVIDDASRDAALVEALDGLAEAGLIELYRHPENLGFVSAANAGMRRHPECDVVLLNSDTQVFGDWLVRLSRIAHSSKDIGTVTPLSNHGEIASYPEWLVDNDIELEVDDATLDALAADACGDRIADAPTAVGFCMYVRRDCLDQAGDLDPAFGRGYGEETDFSLRASALGWRHVIAGGVFVRHFGRVSFGDDASRLRARGEARVRGLHPGYQERIREYQRADPVASLRWRLDAARLCRAARVRDPVRTLLLVTHDWGGGVERHVQDLRRGLECEDANVFLLRPREDASETTVALSHPDVRSTASTLCFRLADQTDALTEALRTLGVDHVHVHQTAGYGADAPTWLSSLVSQLGCAHDFTLHDYTPICPRVHLVARDDAYCGEPEIAACERCIRTLGSPFGRESVAPWRERWSELIGSARRVFCPSNDVLARARHYFPEARLVLRPHMESIVGSPPAVVPRAEGDPLRVAVIGTIEPHKGAGTLLDCARDVARRGLPLEFVVVGRTDRDAQLERTRCVEICGEYTDESLADRLAAPRCHLFWLPSLWPETWSFTLSAALRGGLFPVVFDLGAPAERVDELGWGAVLPLSLRDDPAGLNDALLSLKISARPGTIEAGWRGVGYGRLIEEYYEGFAR